MTKDPYKYFRIEARELLQGLTRGALELEKGQGGAERVVHLLRLAHTLKGASRVVKQGSIAELAHAVEDVLAPFRDGAEALPRDTVSQLLRHLDGVGEKLRDLERPPAALPEAKAVTVRLAKPAVLDDGFETVRIELSEMDAFLDSVAEAGTRVAGLRAGLQSVARARTLARTMRDQPDPGKRDAAVEDLRRELGRASRLLSSDIDQVEARIGRVQENAHRMRLLPASVLFPSLERAARDAAQSVGKAVLFQAAGGDQRLDTPVLGAVREALLHVVRNAVAHGIESPAERAAAGKPAEGTVRVSVERRESRVAFLCADDGRGIDVDAVRAAALQRGLITAAEASSLGFEEAVRLLLKGGLTTTRAVTELSGRGVGLDVLRDAVSRLRGELSIRSQKGRGTTVEILVPVSLSSQAVLLVDCSGSPVSIPLDAVVRNVLLKPADVVRSAHRESIRHQDRLIPLVSLASAIGRKPSPRRGAASPAVILRVGSEEMAACVDRVVGVSRVVARPIPGVAAAEAVVASASMDADGTPRLLLDPAGLIEAARGASAAPEAAAVSRRPLLVIDDSLTTRMLEQSILESAGYEVDLATSGEEGLAKARERRYGLFICDVEMPGMNGFEFVERAKADPALKDVPSVLVTSLASPEDKSRGKRAGARAYIVKGEFDQDHFLGIVRGLAE
jgi:two-component system, chemotaxis family, sensor kinase CheA